MPRSYQISILLRSGCLPVRSWALSGRPGPFGRHSCQEPVRPSDPKNSLKFENLGLSFPVLDQTLVLRPPRFVGIHMLQVFILAACVSAALTMFRLGSVQADGVGAGWLHVVSHQRAPVQQPDMIVTSYDDAALDLLICDQMIEALGAVVCSVKAPHSSFGLELSGQLRSMDYKGRDEKILSWRP